MDAPEIRLRESPRAELAGEARLFLGAAGPPIVARLIDLSTTGMGLAGPAGVGSGQTCAFELAVDGLNVEGRGVVVWSRRPRQDRGDAPNLGARFTDFEGAGAAAIASLVERRLAETRRPVERAAAAAPPAPTSPPLLDDWAAPATVEVAQEPAPERRGSEPAEPATGRRSPLRFLPWLAVVAGVAIVVGLIAGRGEDEPAPRVVPSPTESVPAPQPPLPEPPPVAAVTEPVTAPVIAPPVIPTAVAPVAADSPPEAPAVREATAGARRILSIEPGRGDGDEMLELRADGPFRREDVFAALMGVDPPRYLLRLSGIEGPSSPPTLEVGAPLIQRVRTGLHSTPKGPELHVVLDLASRAVEPAWEIEGDVLRVRLRPRSP